ncbi:crotonyl-CoA carboxylase/reductase [Tsukamurella sp. 8J]|uniref:crotonyl-CoA carboxylase/reductase n=1 Tax=Tsukamurella sp. 8J TaxID=3031962 RepID=UPI0023B9F7AA|nr:crotonyl-CoA carboxylase/reductase [Tsukamurella sp. 8J]MDF0530796.1 crotonyl-CoA carboxylase/reductase [Tsukamurella sp. 8J]
MRLAETDQPIDVGTVPDEMYASVVRPARYGEPKNAFATEAVPTPRPERGEVLVYVKAAGINYNNVWAARGYPLDVVGAREKRGDTTGFHIGGSEASGIVWEVGEGVRSVAPGDHVVLSGCRWDESAEDIRLGGDPMASVTQRVWGYEDNFGAFAQFTVVADFQCHPKPPALSWEAAAAYLLTGATAYRQLRGWEPHVVRPGDPVLVWGGAGGLGSMAIQLVREFGGRAVAVVSSPERAEYCRALGAVGTVDRTGYAHWGRLPDTGDAAFAAWAAEAKRFGRAFFDALGERRAPRIVFEHVGEDTLPTSLLLCDTAGMVVICGGTSGYNGDIDLRYLWMRQKRLQGSHFADLAECRAITALVAAGRIDPCLSWTGTLDDVGVGHQMLADNTQPPGNLAVTVNSA